MIRRPCALLALAALLGCSNKSSGGSGPGASFDSGGVDASFEQDAGGDVREDVSPSDSGAPLDSGSGSDGGSDASALGPGCALLDAEAPDGSCNALVNGATPITGTCQSGTEPSGTGGTIVAGTYLLTAQTDYASSCTAGTRYQVTMLIADGCLERVDGTGASELRRNQDISVQGNQLLRTSSCGAGLPAATYTATPTQLVIFNQGGAVTTWARQ
jgi:hypothetical protein